MEHSARRAPILIHDRLDANRRTLRRLEVAFALAMLPSLLHAGAYLTELLAFLLHAGAVAGPEGASLPWLLGSSAVAACALLVGALIVVRRCSTPALLRLTGARVLDPDAGDEPRLARIVENLCIGSGLPRPRLALVEVPAANAYSTGLARESATLVVTRGLLELLEPREIEGVVAHELAQIAHEDVRVATWTAAVTSLLWLPYLVARRVFGGLFRRRPGLALVGLALFGGWIVAPLLLSLPSGFELAVALLFDPGRTGNPVAGVLLLSLMLLAVYNLAVAPLIGWGIQRALSREREQRADADAALLTRHPSGLTRALAKLGAGGNARLETEPSIAPLWIVDPRGPGRLPRLAGLRTPLDERVAALFRMGGTTPSMLEDARASGQRYARSLRGAPGSAPIPPPDPGQRDAA